jgi:hypothetical protein
MKCKWRQKLFGSNYKFYVVLIGDGSGNDNQMSLPETLASADRILATLVSHTVPAHKYSHTTN